MIILCMMCLMSVSCRSVDPTTLHHTTQSYTTLHNIVDTVLVRDSVYRHDSVIYRERTIHDTVYITKEVYRDRLDARGERQKAVRTDTVVVTEYRDRVVEHPPERYIPKFYKWCTGLLIAILVLAIGYGLLKWYLGRPTR